MSSAFYSKKSSHKEIGLYFVGKKKITALHSEFFDDPTPTDCITFPYHDPKFLGEIFVCPQVASEYVDKQGGKLYEEITLYVVHGFCHLLGYDDFAIEDRKKMRRAEKKKMGELAKNNLSISP